MTSSLNISLIVESRSLVDRRSLIKCSILNVKSMFYGHCSLIIDNSLKIENCELLIESTLGDVL